MPQQKSKVTKPDSWAALFAAEIQRSETVFPPNAKSIEEIMEMRKATGFSSSLSATRRFIASEKKIGRLKVLKGVSFKDGKLNNDARYIIVS